jgi:hypothetical protein
MAVDLVAFDLSGMMMGAEKLYLVSAICFFHIAEIASLPLSFQVIHTVA